MHKRGDSMLVLHSLSGQIEPLTSVYDCVRKRSVDGEYSLSFLIDRTDRNAAQFDVLNNKSRIECDGELYVVDDCEREPDGESVTKQITANHDMYDRLKAQTVEQSYTAQKPLNEWLDIVLAGTGITYEIIGDFGSEQFDNFGMDQSINLFKQLRDRYVFEYRPIDTHLVIAVMIGTVTDAQFRHGHNLRTFSDDYDTNDLVTQVTMFGELDEEGNPTTSVTVQSPNINAFDRVYKLVKKDERYNNTGNLDDYAKTFLNDGKYSAKVEYEELKKNGLKLHNFTWGDFIWCIYDLKGIDVDLQPRIMSIEDYPEDPSKSPVLELGNFQSDITRNIAALQKKGQRVTQLSSSVIAANQAVDNAQVEITQQQQSLTQHLEDNVRHITDVERQKWNSGVSSGDVDDKLQGYVTDDEFESHTSDTSNPHHVTKSQVGLSLVDNIKQAAYDDLQDHLLDHNNPHQVDKTDVCLNNVEDVLQASKEEFDTHTSDTVAHWTQAQRDALEQRLQSIESRLDALDGGGGSFS
jgi:phage minor structural protein